MSLADTDALADGVRQRLPVRTSILPLDSVAQDMHVSPVQSTSDDISNLTETIMPRGSKSKYSGKQKRQAEHIEESYEKRGTGKKEAERRAWATVNKSSHGGKKSGSGRGKTESHESSHKGGAKGGHASATRSKAARSAAAKKGAATRKRNAHAKSHSS